MNRAEFLEALAAQLEMLSDAERERSLAFYGEMIDDRVEAGATEKEAVAMLGPVEEIAAGILMSAPAPVRKKRVRKLRGWEIALIVIGSPVWLPLLVAAAVVALALLIVLWALVASLWAAALALALCVPMAVVSNVVALLRWNLLQAAMDAGVGCVSAGLAIFMLLAVLRVTRGAARLTRRCWMAIRRAR